MATTPKMTGAQFDALPLQEGRRWELINGELVPVPSPTWRHQDIAFQINLAFKQYFKTSAVVGLVAQDVEFALTADDRVRPDVCVMLGEKAVRLDRDCTPIPGAPDLAIEVISPSESASASHDKVRRYLKCGTSEVWQIYLTSRTEQIHQGNSANVIGEDECLTTGLLPGLSIPVATLFE